MTDGIPSTASTFFLLCFFLAYFAFPFLASLLSLPRRASHQQQVRSWVDISYAHPHLPRISSYDSEELTVARDAKVYSLFLLLFPSTIYLYFVDFYVFLISCLFSFGGFLLHYECRHVYRLD